MAGKGDSPRKVVLEVFRAHHDFIFGVMPSYRPSDSGDDCALRGKGEGKCWGPVTNCDRVCSGHAEYFDWRANKLAARAYIPEQ